MPTNFEHGLASYGVPVYGDLALAGTGNRYWVNYTTGNDATAAKSNSKDRPWKTIAKAYSAVETNKDDMIILHGSASHVLTEMLTVSKNRVHFRSADPALRMYGQNAKISMGVTSAATDLGVILNTGVRNSFENIKFTSANTKDESLYTFLEGGEYTKFDYCEFYKGTDLDQTTAAEFVCNGDSAQFYRCTFGSIADAQTGTTIRPSVLLTAGVAGSGKVSRDVIFDDCLFWKSAGHVNGRHVYGANATDIERMMLFNNCVFINSKIAAAVPAQCVATGSSLTVGQVLLNNCASINNTKLTTTTGMFVTGAVPTAATTGIAVNGA